MGGRFQHHLLVTLRLRQHGKGWPSCNWARTARLPLPGSVAAWASSARTEGSPSRPSSPIPRRSCVRAWPPSDGPPCRCAGHDGKGGIVGGRPLGHGGTNAANLGKKLARAPVRSSTLPKNSSLDAVFDNLAAVHEEESHGRQRGRQTHFVGHHHHRLMPSLAGRS